MLKKLKTKFIFINMLLVTIVLFIVLTINLVSTYQIETKSIYSSLDRIMEIDTRFGNNKNEPQGDNPGEFVIGNEPSENPGGDQPGEAIDPNNNDNPGEFTIGGDTNEQPGGNENPGANQPGGTIEPGKNENPNMRDENLPQIYAFSVTVDNEGNILNTFAFNSLMDEDEIKEAVNDVLLSEEESGKLTKYNLIYKVRIINNDQYQISFSSLSSLKEKMNRTFMISLLIFVTGFALLFFVSFILSSLAIKPIETAWNQQKQFVADASHDLKTPLTVILANCNILESHKEETINNEIKWIESTKEETSRMKGMVESLLELSKTENLKNKIELTTLNISNIIEESTIKMDSLAFENGVNIESNIEKDIIVNSNYEALSKVVEILIDNAIKYSKKDTTIKVNLNKNKKDSVLSINNIGEVIDEKDIPHLFDRFYRTDESRTNSGYGLGLSIAKNLIDCLNATVKVTSSLELGTTFTITFK